MNKEDCELAASERFGTVRRDASSLFREHQSYYCSAAFESLLGIEGAVAFRVGDKVRLAKKPAEVGEVVQVVPSQSGQDSWYKVRFPNGPLSVPGGSLIESTIPNEPEDQLRAGVIGGMPDLRLLLTWLRLKERNLTDQLRSLRAARLKHLPYQYKPLLKLLESPEQRVLVADEVGLGKTIEAGIILLELMARQEVSRILIVVPSNLVLKWQAELRDRFELEFEHRNNAWVRDNVLDPVRDGKELSPFRAVCSLEAIRLLADDFDEIKPPIDLVICDEAHRLRNDSSLSHKLGRALGEASEAMVLCSATPMQTASTDLYNLLRVMVGDRAGSFADFQSDLAANRPIVRASTALSENGPMADVRRHLESARLDIERARPSDLPMLESCIKQATELRDDDTTGRVELMAEVSRLNWFGSVMTRTRKRMVMKNVAPRIAQAVNIRFSPEELAFYENICSNTRQVAANGKWSPATFAAIMRQRQAASCLAAFLEPDHGGADADGQAALSVELEADSQSTVLERPSAPPTGRLPTDSKLKALLRLLNQLEKEDAGFKLILFATFRATIGYLASKLREEGWDIEVLTGDVTDRLERARRIQRVKNDRGCRMLLATEVGCEGIDLQFASTLVNYDLPWNPMVVEQRIGRLDRIGQTASSIRIFNLAVENTVEEKILTRLYERLHLFQDSIGALEVIIGERVQRLALDLARLSPAQQTERLNQEQIALENLQREGVTLDAEATNLIGDDAWHAQRLAEIERRQGDIAADLHAFVSDFLAREFKHAELQAKGRTTPRNVYLLTFDSELLAFINEHRGSPGSAGAAFAGKFAEGGARGGMLVTFNQEAADAERGVEFLTSTHSFIHAIGARLEKQTTPLVRIFSTKLHTQVVPPGRYLLAMALHRVSGIRPRNEVVAGGVRLDDAFPLDDDQVETLLGEVHKSGETVQPSATPLQPMQDHLGAAEQSLYRRCDRTRQQVEQQNALFVARRIDSVNRWYGNRIAKLTERSKKHDDIRVRRMAAGQVARLSSRLEGEIKKAENARSVDVEVRIEGFLAVHVEP